MRSTTLIAMAALATSLAAVPPAGAAPHPRTATIHLRAQLLHVASVDAAPAGPSPNDQLTFTERLFDAHGHRAGSDAATCVQLFDRRALCTGVYALRRGQVMVQLVQPGPTQTYSQAVTGGTGRFAGVTGTVTVRQKRSGDRFVLHLRWPRN